MCVCVVYVGYVLYHGYASLVRFHIAHERMASSGGCHQGSEVQVQDKHLEKIICLKLVIHLVIMELRGCALVKLPHSGVWGSKLEVFMKQQ
jgi:hypothetical protein